MLIVLITKRKCNKKWSILYIIILYLPRFTYHLQDRLLIIYFYIQIKKQKTHV